MEDEPESAALTFQLCADAFRLQQNRINLPVSTQPQRQRDRLLTVWADKWKIPRPIRVEFWAMSIMMG